MNKLHTCMLCEAVCGVVVDVEAGRVTSVRGDPDDPFSRGHVCPKAAALPDIAADPDRVVAPLRRTGTRWETVTWDDALDDIAARFARLQREQGRSAVGLYLGNPTVHSHGALLAVPLFSRLLGSRARFSATSVDQLPHMLASLEVLGSQILLPVPDLDRTRFLLVLGGNPLASNGSLMTAGNVKARLAAIRARGGRVVVVDPRRTETADVADAHCFIRPGTDALLLLAMLQVIFAEGRDRPGRLAAFTDGLDALRDAAKPFPPERVAAVVGMDAEAIRTLARDFAAAESACAYGRVGLCTQELGGLAAWLVLALNVVTGNLDWPGGAMFPTPAIDLVGLGHGLGQQGHFDVWRSRVRGLPEFGGELPAATMAEEIETPGKGQIRGLVTFAGNPVLSTPNGARLDRALAGLELMVSIDLYVNETTRHAHYILPTSFGLERAHHDLAFYAFAVRNAARWVDAATDPPPGVRSDWDVITDLALRLHGAGGGRREAKTAWLLRAARALGTTRIVDLLLRLGPYGTFRGGTMSLAHLRAHPHGVDLGPLVPQLPGRLATKDRRVHLAPPRLLADVARAEARVERGSPGRDALVLIGRRQLRSNNSWMHNSLRLVKGRERCTLLVHPEDAAPRGLRTGDRATVRSRKGELTAPVEVTDAIGRGVVSLPHGWGHDREGTRLDVARRHAGISVNDLTDEDTVDLLSGTAVLNGVEVRVERVTAADAGTGERLEPIQHGGDQQPVDG